MGTTYEKVIDRWQGLNLRPAAEDGELCYSKNLSGREFPHLCPRAARQRLGPYSSPTAIFGWNGLVVCDNNILYYNGAGIDNVLAGEKQFCVINTKLCIFPDKKYIDLVNNEYKTLEAEAKTRGTVTLTENSIKAELKPTLSAGVQLPAFTVSDSGEQGVWAKFYGTDETAINWSSAGWVKPAGTAKNIITEDLTGQIFIPKISESGKSFSLASAVYAGTTAPEVPAAEENSRGYYGVITGHYRPPMNDGGHATRWYRADIYHIKEGGAKFSDYFRAGDRVSITGATVAANNKKLQLISDISDADNKISFSDNIFSGTADNAEIIIRRPVPELDFVCEANNRLWGCSNADKTIYASALGDPTRWYEFNGAETDSYQVAVASKGDFTGCIAYAGQVLFSKEDAWHRVAGEYPSVFAVYTDNFEGVHKGSHKSLVIMNEILYFKGRSGVYAYSGGQPVLLSHKLGEDKYFDACAGADGMRYYISMKDAQGAWHLFSFEQVHGIWLREDDSDATDFAYEGGVLYMATAEGVFALNSETAEESITWEAVTAESYFGSFRQKFFKTLRLRCEMDKGADLTLRVSFDSGGFSMVKRIAEAGRHILNIPVPDNRADSMQIRLEGSGKAVIKTLAAVFELMSEEV